MNLINILQDETLQMQKDRIYGVVVGVVTNNQDPENSGRIKIKFPWLSDDNESFWARMAVLMAGNERGTWFPPQVEDEVLVAFEHGDINRPIVIGAMWNGRDKPPTTELEHFSITDINGSFLKFDSRSGNIEIEAKEEMNIKAKKIVISASDQTIEIDAIGEVIINGEKIQLNP